MLLGYAMRDTEQTLKALAEQVRLLKVEVHALRECPPTQQTKYGNVKQLAQLYGMSARSVQNGIQAAIAKGHKIRAIAAPTGASGRIVARYYIDDVTRAFAVQ